jgi:ADP-heptose:LPS heptosyltransferase
LARSSGWAGRIAVVADLPFQPIYEGNPDVDEILSPSVQSLRRFRPDAVLNLHGGTRSAWLTAASGARWRAGFAHYRFQALYNVRIPRAQEILGVHRKVHTAEHAASAMFHLGVPPQPVPRAKLNAAPVSRPRPYAVIHPLAATSAKTWPASNFIETARSLDLDAVFIGSPADDLTPFRGFECVQRPLRETMALIAGASLFLGNDSGPAHLAAAFGVPSVVLFGPSDEVVWAPWRTVSRVLKDPDVSRISADSVRAAVLSLGVAA